MGSLSNSTGACIRKRKRGRSFFLFMHTYRGQVTWRHSKKLPSSSQEESSHHSLIMLAPSSQICHLQNCEKRSFCSLRHPLYLFCYKSPSRLRQPLYPTHLAPATLASFLFLKLIKSLPPQNSLPALLYSSIHRSPPLSILSSDNLI